MLLAESLIEEDGSPLPIFPQLQSVPRILPSRVASMFKILVSAVCYEVSDVLLAVIIF